MSTTPVCYPPRTSLSHFEGHRDNDFPHRPGTRSSSGRPVVRTNWDELGRTHENRRSRKTPAKLSTNPSPLPRMRPHVRRSTALPGCHLDETQKDTVP